MANKKQSMIFEITGNESGLKQSLKNAGNSLSEFNNKAGGAFGNVDELLTSTGAAFGTFAGGVGIAATAAMVAISKMQVQAEKAFEVFQSASLAQTGIENLQKQANMFAEVGLTMDNVADQIKDSKDKLGDALTNQAGSMYTDVIQPLKLNIIELQKAADGGEDIIAKIYYQAKQMGFSQSQIINMLETVANDADKRMTIYQRFNSEQEYQNQLASESVQLTGEQSSQFQAYRKSTQELSKAWEAWNNSALAPVAANLADILNLMTKILNSKPVAAAAAATSREGIAAVQEYQKGYQQDILKNSSIYGAQLVEEQQKDAARNQKTFDNMLANLDKANNLIQKQREEYNKGFEKSTINAAMKPFQTAKQETQSKIDALDKQYKDTRAAIQQSLLKGYQGNQDALNKDLATLDAGYKETRADLVKKLTESADKAAASAATKAAAAAKKAEAEEKQRLAKQVQAQKVLDQTMAAMGANAAQVKLQQFNLQQNEIEKRIKESAALTKKSEDETNAMLNTHYADRARNYKEMVDQMLAENDRLKQAQNIAAIANDPNATPEQKAAAAAAGNKWATNTATQGLGYQDPFNTQADPTKLAAIGTEQQNNKDGAKALYDAKVIGFQEYQDQLTAIQTNADIKRARATADALNGTIGLWGNAAGDIGTTLAGAFGQGNDAAKAFFAVQKGIAIAQSIINIQQGISEATKLGWPAGIAAGLKVAAEGAKIISTIKGTNIQGQAHDGWDSLPSTGTYNLEKGERVVGKSLNQDLTNYLKDGGNKLSGEIKIEAPLVIQSNGDITDKDFTEMCKKHADVLVQAVRQSQQRNV
ncbi:TPA: hypothetical protein RU934_003945 [Escherichia coli]|uniref:hypothetical protein n=2 Tax=Escherichia coli TaxID=562 RepID=UPI000B510AF6|nr:hypothetical protein [Escherichia coli]EEW1581984.1 hypothetical protein [Escherichia coli]EEX2536853.1 hypothetical protein [Escherichia coli]EEX2795889.1 hypothetical protein [Escherichia coli]EFA9604804.1 hypothetical protein [Escherichia coli]EFD9699885.1 hypothetical protein [Escherichia coli]